MNTSAIDRSTPENFMVVVRDSNWAARVREKNPPQKKIVNRLIAFALPPRSSTSALKTSPNKWFIHTSVLHQFSIDAGFGTGNLVVYFSMPIDLSP
jgi:hypothetical protein